MKTSYSKSHRRNAAQWTRIVAQSETSGLPLRAFCAEIGVSLPSLYYWRSKLKAAGNPKLDGFTQLSPPAQERRPSESVIELTLANGRTIRVTGGPVDGRSLRTVIEAAEAGVPC